MLVKKDNDLKSRSNYEKFYMYMFDKVFCYALKNLVFCKRLGGFFAVSRYILTIQKSSFRL